MNVAKPAALVAICGFTLSGCSGEVVQDDYSIRAQLESQNVPEEAIALVESEIELRANTPVRKASPACPQYSETIHGGVSEAIMAACTEGRFEHFCILYDFDIDDGSGNLGRNNNGQGSTGEYMSAGFKLFLNQPASESDRELFPSVNTRCHVRNNQTTGAEPPTFTRNGEALFTTYQYGAIPVGGAAVDSH